jgi:hypothetical protein
MYLEKKGATSKRQKIPDGWLATAIETVEEEYGIEKGTINPYTIMSRARRNNVTGFAPQKNSPLHEIEPFLVEWCIAMAQCGQALKRNDVIDLASDLIKGTQSEKNMIEYKRKRGFEANEGGTVLGVTWYQSFMRCHGDELKRGKCIPKDIIVIRGVLLKRSPTCMPKFTKRLFKLG